MTTRAKLVRITAAGMGWEDVEVTIVYPERLRGKCAKQLRHTHGLCSEKSHQRSVVSDHENLTEKD